MPARARLSGDHGPAAILELAGSCGCCRQFGREVFALLDASVAHACAFLALPASAQIVGRGYSEQELATLAHRVGSFESELEPVKRAALRSGGVAVDTAVLGSRARRARYYRELVAPAGGGHSLMCYLQVRGRALGTLVIGRGGRGFGETDLACIRRVAPALAFALASYPAAPARQAGPLASVLSPREREIASYLSLGYTNREIAVALGSSANTVRNQLSAIFRKVGATTRAELVGLLLRA